MTLLLFRTLVTPSFTRIASRPGWSPAVPSCLPRPSSSLTCINRPILVSHGDGNTLVKTTSLSDSLSLLVLDYATYNIYEQEPSAFVNPGPKVYSGASTDTVDEEVVVGGEDEETTSTGGVIVEDQQTASSGISSSSSSSVGTVTASEVVSIQTEVAATETGEVAATTSSSDWVDATETGEVTATGTGDVAATSSSSEWVDAPQETSRGYGRGGRKHGCTDDHQAQQTDAANYAGRRNGKRRL